MNNMYGGECIVPINKKGIEELDDMSIENSKNWMVFKVSSEEVEDFFLSDDSPITYFSELDELSFDIYFGETGLIPFEYVGQCLAVMQQHSKFPDGAIAKALKTALNYGTCVEVTIA